MVCAYRLHQDFAVVSVLEKLEMGLEVLECLLPSYFKVLDGPKKKLQKDIQPNGPLSGRGQSSGQNFSPPQRRQ